ncbi:anti-phage deoxyguanosine triphosphatase [Psychrobacter faecalis]
MTDSINKTQMEKRRKDQPHRDDDVRTEFDRDEARLIHSAAFRRLQAKTQVLGLGESDFYRTRLTHSMEVGQIGRGIVQYIEKSGKFKDYVDYLPDMALITAICLAHDIGHPPFGHGGEVALNYCMREHGGFEGNGQTLRILGKIEKYTKQHGLNPTRRMLLGVLKYPSSYQSLVNEGFYGYDKDTYVKNEKGGKSSENFQKPYWLFKAKLQKPPKCYYDADKDIVDFISQAFDEDDFIRFSKAQSKKEQAEHDETKYKSFDCTIMNLADNISYSLHDLEDALSLKMIDQKQWESYFKDESKSFDETGLFSEVKIHEYDKSEYSSKFDFITEKLFSNKGYIRKGVIGCLVNFMITNVIIEDNGSGCVHPLLRYEVKLKTEVEKLRKILCKIVYEIVIMDRNVQQLEFKGQKTVIELFQVLSEDPERFLPESAKQKWYEVKQEKLSDEDKESAQLRVICDFIAGMTDDYATKFYEKFFTPNKGSIFDRL